MSQPESRWDLLLKMDATCFSKSPLTFNGLHGIKSQKIELFITAAVRTMKSFNAYLLKNMN
jgi:hypothetical protein